MWNNFRQSSLSSRNPFNLNHPPQPNRATRPHSPASTSGTSYSSQSVSGLENSVDGSDDSLSYSDKNQEDIRPRRTTAEWPPGGSGIIQGEFFAGAHNIEFSGEHQFISIQGPPSASSQFYPNTRPMEATRGITGSFFAGVHNASFSGGGTYIVQRGFEDFPGAFSAQGVNMQPRNSTAPASSGPDHRMSSNLHEVSSDSTSAWGQRIHREGTSPVPLTSTSYSDIRPYADGEFLRTTSPDNMRDLQPTLATSGYRDQKVLSDYVLNVEHDFQTDGKPASWFPQHPKNWGSEIARIEFPSSAKPTFLSLSDDDSHLAITIDNNIHIYTIERSGPNRKEVLIQPKKILQPDHNNGSNVSFVEFQPGSHDVLVSCGDAIEDGRKKNIIRVWDMKMKQEEEEDSLLSAAEAAANTALQILTQRKSSWSQDSSDFQTFRIAKSFEGILRSAARSAQLLHGTIKYRTFSHDGAFIIVFPGGGRPIAVVAMDGFPMRERCRLLSNSDDVVWAEFSPDDRVIGTCSSDKALRIWNAENGDLIHTLLGATSHAAFSPDGKLIAAGAGEHHVRLWNVETGELVNTLQGYNHCARNLCFSPDRKSLAAGAGGGTLRLFDVSTGECTQHWQTSLSLLSGFKLKSFLEVANVQYTTQGLLVFNTTDGRKFTFDARTNQKGLFEHKSDVTRSVGTKNCVVSSDGTLLFTIDFDDILRVWAL